MRRSTAAVCRGARQTRSRQELPGAAAAPPPVSPAATRPLRPCRVGRHAQCMQRAQPVVVDRIFRCVAEIDGNHSMAFGIRVQHLDGGSYFVALVERVSGVSRRHQHDRDERFALRTL